MIFKSSFFCLQNMVGPGEVDEELNPEVKDECQAKYGEVQEVLILQETIWK